MAFTLTVQSLVKCPKPQLWQHVTQMQNVNYELMPIVRMTFPAGKAAINGQQVPMHIPLFTSTLLLFGFIPIDLHHLTFDKIIEGECYYENSTTLTHKFWKHTRILTAVDNGTMVNDEVSFQPHVPLLGYLLLPLYKATFKHRHRKLTAYFKP